MMLHPTLHALSWRPDQLTEAVEALAYHAFGESRPSAPLPPHPPLDGPNEDNAQALTDRIGAAAAAQGLETELTIAPYPDVLKLMRRAGPAVLVLPEALGRRLLLLTRGGRRGPYLLGPDLRPQRVEATALRSALCASAEGRHRRAVDGLLDPLDLPPRQRKRAEGALYDELLTTSRSASCWMLKRAPSDSFHRQLRDGKVTQRLGLLTLSHVAQQALLIMTWWVAGLSLLSGRLDSGWLAAWALLLITQIPLRMAATALAGRITIDGGAIVRQRLLAGILAMDDQVVRRQGVGRVLARILETEAVENLALGGGMQSVMATVEVCLAVAILAVGAGGAAHALSFAAMLVALGWLVRRQWRLQGDWTRDRLEMTHDLTERMLGHRTRLLQSPRERWHEGEDEAVSRYYQATRALDDATVRFTVGLPRLWLLVGLVALTGPFMTGAAGLEALAVSIGGVIFAYQGLRRLTAGLFQVLSAAIAWQRVGMLYRAAADGAPAPPSGLPAPKPPAPGETILHAMDLSYHFPGRSAAALSKVDLTVHAGDRLLLEGSSGSGKSTLGSLLAGLRQPSGGLLLLRGLDQSSLGVDRWRKRSASAPQFHENIVFSGPLAFNLLMGHSWPPTPSSLAEAERVCRALGLGPLIDRMPAGLMQLVGEIGWQLSHGERSRLYLARVLLQAPELMILDESFAALDPQTLSTCLTTVQDEANALIVIAHP